MPNKYNNFGVDYSLNAGMVLMGFQGIMSLVEHFLISTLIKQA